jgi:hypothetical protein
MKKLLNIPESKITLAKYRSGTGNAPCFSYPDKNTASILERIKEIEEVFNDDGSFNLSFPKLEEYALCLHEDNKEKEALNLFILIADSSKKLLFRNKEGGFQPVENTIGKLGIEGIYIYAHLLKISNKNKKANKLFLEIVDNYPFKMGIRGNDIASDSIDEVLQSKSYPKFREYYYTNLEKEIKKNVY